MCGIVGYVGTRDALPILIEGLKRLEYRGYDSSGVATISNGELWIRKSVGKIRELEARIDGEAPESTIGLSHTRWATHGAPSDVNAHPHTDENETLAVVHNGIIENYSALKTLLQKDGHVFVSETDTEVLVHLIEKFYDGSNLLAALRKALEMVHGTYGIIVASKTEPDKLIAARHGSPLVLGIGEGEYFLASDVAPIVPYTRHVIYFEDDEIVVVDRDGYKTTTLAAAEPIFKSVSEVDWNIEEIEKGGFAHFMLKEIHEQPETVANSMRGRMILPEGISQLHGLNLNLDALRQIKRVIIAGCGTSWHAGLVGEYIIEEVARIPVEVEYASEFRYRNPIIDSSTAVFLISQSGETADTLAALREAKNKGALPLGIVNVVGSTIARESAGGVYIHAGPEIGVASTKAFTSQITVLTLIGLLLGRQRDLSTADGKKILRGLLDLPGKLKKILARSEQIEAVAEHYANAENFLYLGRGINFPVALEGALKLKEISYIHAEGYPAAEMKHGPIALIDENMPVVVIAIRDSAYEKILSNIQEIRARRGRIIAIASEGDTEIHKYADHVIEMPQTHPLLSPILSVLPLQLLAYYIAVKRGCDVDQPRNLAKSVTVE